MLHPSIPWLLLAAPVAYCLWVAAGPHRGRRRAEPDTEPGLDGPLPAPEMHEEQALDELEQQVGTLNERLGSFDTKFQTLAKSNEQLYGLLKSCTTQLYQSLQEIGQHKDRLATALARQRELEALNLAQKREVERDSTRLRELELEATRRARETDSTLRQLAEVEGALAVRVLELDRRAVDAQRESVQRVEQLAAAEQRCADLEALAQRQADELLEGRQLERELREQTLQQHATRASAHDLEGSLSGRIAELEADIARRDDELRQQLEARNASESRASEREEAQSARIGELQGELAQLELQQRERSAALEVLGNELADRNARCEERSRRCSELEQELRERSLALENLRSELADKSARGEERSRRCSELEDELRMQVEEQRVIEQRAREVEQELAGRLRELEQRAREVEQELAGRLRELELRAERREVELRERSTALEELRVALARDAGQDETFSRRSAELDGQLAARDEELQLLRAECARLAEHGQTLSRALDARGVELQALEFELAESRARIDELECADARRESQHLQELAFVDELAEGRIASFLPGQASGAAEPLPQVYLEGMEKRDLGLALRGLLGGSAPLSITSMLRLGEHWRSRQEAWKSEPIEGEVAYLWADAPFVRAGLEPDGAALLVVVAGLVDGSRRLVAVEAGLRDSVAAWRAVLEDLVRRGMKVPRLVIAEDGLGLWPALAELGWFCAQQRCWERRIEHVVDALPGWRQRKAGERLRAIANAKTQARAVKLKDAFVKHYRVRHPEAVARLQSDWAQMVSLFSFPEEHWPLLRTTGVVESLLGTLRLHTSQAKPYPRTPDALAILWKLLLLGARGLRRLQTPEVGLKRAAGKRPRRRAA